MENNIPKWFACLESMEEKGLVKEITETWMVMEGEEDHRKGGEIK